MNPELAEQKPATEETEDTEKETGTEEVIESDKVSNEILKYSIRKIAILIIIILNFCNIHNAFPFSFFIVAIFSHENAHNCCRIHHQSVVKDHDEENQIKNRKRKNYKKKLLSRVHAIFADIYVILSHSTSHLLLWIVGGYQSL